MAKVSCNTTEKKIISLLMTPPVHMKALHLNLGLFNNKSTKLLATLIKKFVEKYKCPPTKDSIKDFANTQAQDAESLNAIADSILLLDELPKMQASDAEYYFKRVENYKLGRDLHDVIETLSQKFEKEEIDFVELRQKTIADLLKMGADDSDILRGHVYESVQARWEQYRNTAKGKKEKIIPFGMKALDDKIGGMHKSFVTLMYSKTGGGKSRTAINIAYNAALAGYNVMYFSLEMAFDLLASCFDSRMAWVDSNKIIFGKLDAEDKKSFKQALVKQFADKLNIWIVDIRSGATSAQIFQEIELYKATKGVNPDLVVVDYANLMIPISKYSNRSERYDNLFKEFHEVARFFDVALLTATQESRDASKADINKKKKDEDEEGVHNIGLSNFMAPHCEIVLRLKQDKYDKLQNRLWAIVDKTRYGKSNDHIQLFSAWAQSYVGDKLVPGTIVYNTAKIEENQCLT